MPKPALLVFAPIVSLSVNLATLANCVLRGRVQLPVIILEESGNQGPVPALPGGSCESAYFTMASIFLP